MKINIPTYAVLSVLVLSCQCTKEAEKSKQTSPENKQNKRGLFDFGYGHGFEGFGHEIGGHLGEGIEEHGHVKHITIHKEVPVPVPHPVPYPVEKRVPYPVKVPYHVPVDKPYPVHVPKPYPVHIPKPVPYPVYKRVPYPVKYPVKVPYPVPRPYPVPKPVPYIVHKPVPYPVKVPVVVKKPYPVYIKHHHEEEAGGLESGFEGGHFEFGGEELHHHE